MKLVSTSQLTIQAICANLLLLTRPRGPLENTPRAKFCPRASVCGPLTYSCAHVFGYDVVAWCSTDVRRLPQTEVLEIVGAALVALLAAQPAMTDDVPQLGHLPKILAAMTCRDTAVPKAAVRVVHRFADSAVRGRHQSRRAFAVVAVKRDPHTADHYDTLLLELEDD